MAGNGYSSTKKLPCPAADKENVDRSPVEFQSDAAPRRPYQRTPLQDHTNAEVDVDSKSKHRNKRAEYWVTQDGELYTTKAGPLMRSFSVQLKTLKWLRSKDDVFLVISTTTTCDLQTSTPNPTPQSRQAGPVEVVNPPTPDPFLILMGDQRALSLVPKWIDKWTNNIKSSSNQR